MDFKEPLQALIVHNGPSGEALPACSLGSFGVQEKIGWREGVFRVVRMPCFILCCIYYTLLYSFQLYYTLLYHTIFYSTSASDTPTEILLLLHIDRPLADYMRRFRLKDPRQGGFGKQFLVGSLCQGASGGICRGDPESHYLIYKTRT